MARLLEWIEEARKISADVAAKHGVRIGRWVNSEFQPDDNGNVISFPSREHGTVVAEKFRSEPKKFWQRPGGKPTFWNADIIDDPSLTSGAAPLIITEGEFDALTAIQCGFPFAVSVPMGAPLNESDPSDDATGKFAFLWNNRERLRAVKRFVIAADGDAAGEVLAGELVRRLSAARCFFIRYPQGCKDLNDVLVKHGADAVTATLNAAQAYPVKGLYRLSDYPSANRSLQVFSTGWETVDLHLKLFLGELLVVSGIPSMGKSAWVLNFVCNLATLHGWRSAIFSPEMPTVPHLRDKFRRIIARGSDRADCEIEKHFVFIDSEPSGAGDEDMSLDWLLERASDAVLRDGIRVLVIDPWNELDHARRRDENQTDYVGRSLRALKQFAQRFGVVVIVVAHPTKLEADRNGKYRTPTLYDIEGSAHWFNKCDHGVILERPDPATTDATVWIAKARFEESGEKGSIRLRYSRYDGRFETLEPKQNQAERLV